MSLSKEAAAALVDLEHGARFNCLGVVSRELIDGGYAFDGWGKLEITEMGRRAARTLRSFTAVGPHVSNMGDSNEPMWTTPLNSHHIVDPDFTILPVAPITSVIPDPPGEKLAWSRERAMRAAGLANSVVDVFVEPQWMLAFMDAYEQI